MSELVPEPLEPGPLVPGSSDLDLLSASLRADASDNDTFFEVLAAKLGSALGERAILEREGIRKRGRVRRISLDLGGMVYTASRDKGRISCQARRAVRGIVLRTDELDLDAWLGAVAASLTEEARHSAITRAALQSLLT